MGTPFQAHGERAETVQPGLCASFKRFSRIAAAIVLLIGVAALTGWLAGIPFLTQLLPGTPAMAPSTAGMFILGGAALVLASREPRTKAWWAAKGAAGLVLLLALAAVAAEFFAGVAGVDQLLRKVMPARSALTSAIAFVFGSVALLFLDVGPRARLTISELFALAAGTLSIGGVMAHVYGSPYLVSWSERPELIEMAVPSAIGLLLFSAGILGARPAYGVMSILTGVHVGSVMSRRLMLTAGLAIPLIGLIAVIGQVEGLYAAPGASILAVVASLIVVMAAIFVVGRALNEADARRWEAEQELAVWKHFFEHASAGFVADMPDGTLSPIMNEAFARMHGCTIEELAGRPVAAVFAPSRREGLAEELERIHTYGAYRWESEHVRKDGTVFPVVIDATAVKDSAGNVLYRAAYVQDITEEHETRRAQARLATIVESAGEAMIVEALDGAVLTWNPAAERIFGYSAAEMIGQSILRVVPPEERAPREALLEKLLRGEEVHGVEVVRLRKDGARIPVSLSLTRLRDGSGGDGNICAIERDISAQKAAEEELSRLREEWAAVISHDLRQPVSAIRLSVATLSRAEPCDQARVAIERIRIASDRLVRMIDDLLDVSRIAANQLTIRPAVVCLPEIVEQVLETLPEVAPRCRVDIPRDAPKAWADPDRVVQVLCNLLSNAGKYSTPGTEILLVVERAGDAVRVTVTNVGPGIPKEEQQELFHRFSRTRGARAGKIAGLGLGLYISKGLVEAQGGQIAVESTPGRTTSFSFTLPLAVSARCAAGM
ncbi:sensor histidine kinase [Polyangium spumosum]|uniref:histidine kinase n=1 Tax=Polyangium spumosum TaxID=889282 RepID=A0A6N7PNQ9_9BACT|nr:PAS domain S-box protein [Polyangium spumosum]MRG93653.1 PAS domain S-box protein [Polyangium spumosum]